MARSMSRREWPQGTMSGFGMLALSGLMAEESYAGLLCRKGVHFKPRAKRVVFCDMDGGVSHVDSFDPKAKLTDLSGKDVGRVDNVTAGGHRKWLKSPFTFKQ